MTEQDVDPLVEVITEYWGERCPDFDPDCHCCKTWKLYDDYCSQSERIAALTAGLKRATDPEYLTTALEKIGLRRAQIEAERRSALLSPPASAEPDSAFQDGWDAHELHLAMHSEPASGAVEAGWQPIETAGEWERALVAGWQPPSKRVAGYWWIHEDEILDGKPHEHPSATLWHPFPAFPAAPREGR